MTLFSLNSQAKKAKMKIANEKLPLNLIKNFSETLKTLSYSRFLSVRKAKTFLIVRHPLTRLVSAFRDKIERSYKQKDVTKDWYYKVYGKTIVSKYRKRAIAKFGQDYFKANNNYGSLLILKEGYRNEKLPIFWEFVQYVLDTGGKTDVHWMPMYQHCSLCTVDYDYVFKSENLHDEERRWLENVIIDTSETNVESKDQNVAGINADIAKLYLNTLDLEDVKNLFELYKTDFLLFGYSFKFRNITFP